jgi:hypothetical protein
MEHATAMLVGQQMQMTARPAYEPTRVLSRHQPMHAPVKINGDSD